MKGIQINPGDRAVFVGMTGSGKTYAAGRYAQSIAQPLLAIDVKGMWDLPNPETRNVAYVQDINGVNQASPTHDVIIYQPGIEQDVVEDVNGLLVSCYYARNRCVYIDELYGLSEDGRRWPDKLNPVYTRGRQLGLTVLSCVQRPTRVPLFAITESEHLFVFDLNLYDDRQRMSGIIGERAMRNPIEVSGQEYTFWYHNSRWPQSKQIMVPCRINGITAYAGTGVASR